MPSVTFKPHCDKYQIRKDGTSTLYMRITIDRKSKLVSLNKYIDPQLFDYDTKRIKTTKDSANAKQLNRFLSEEENRLEDIILELQKRDKPVSFENVIREYVADTAITSLSIAGRSLPTRRCNSVIVPITTMRLPSISWNGSSRI